MSIADTCLYELCPLGERTRRRQERNSRGIPVLPLFSCVRLARMRVLNKRVDWRLACVLANYSELPNNLSEKSRCHQKSFAFYTRCTLLMTWCERATELIYRWQRYENCPIVPSVRPVFFRRPARGDTNTHYWVLPFPVFILTFVAINNHHDMTRRKRHIR